MKPKKNVFDLTHDVKLSCDMGNLVPIMTLEAVPGDKFNLSAEALVRFAPMTAPVMHRMDVSMHYFFVPNRILWSNWEKFISDYLMKRETLMNIFILLDSRLEPQKIDMEFINLCGEKQLPFVMVFTKIDKLSSSELQRNLAKFKKEMLKVLSPVIKVIKKLETKNIIK